MSDVLEGLKRAKELIERGWTQNTRARDAEGDPTHADSADAVMFCVEGACVRAAFETGIDGWAIEDRLETALGKRGFNASIARWNDRPDRTKEEVLTLMEEAIHDAKE